VTWDFGDGTIITSAASQGPISATHTYTTNDTYTVTLTVTDDDNSLTVDGTTSQSTVKTISSSGVSGGELQVGGSGGSNVINIKPSGGDTQVTIDGNTTTFGGVSKIVVMGGDGNDDIKVHPGVMHDVIVFGGGGNDSIKGGAGDDILIGGDGDDLLHGADGEDILIGGDGADRIVGNAEDDILVAGISTHDSDLEALLQIQEEWISENSYAQRSANILNREIGGAMPGSGANESYFLTPDNYDATVFDDGDEDILTGNQGDDLFLFNADGPVADVITDLKAAEFAEDLEWLMSE
jgi:Ca2+-binding RTX toxin-like protein